MSSPVRVVRHESDLGRWELHIRRPAPGLEQYVTSYEGYVEHGPRPGAGVRRQQVPTTRLPFIVNFGSPWSIADGPSAGTGEVRDSFFAGLFDTSSYVAATGPARCLQIDFTPLGAHVFFGLPMHELANRVVDLDVVLPAAVRTLPERLAGAASWEARFAILDDLLARRLADGPSPSPEVVWAWQKLETTKGRVAIGSLSSQLGRSRRHFVARFREQVGLPPKTVARILRFDNALGLLGRWEASLAELALECGYYDQAHLNRDFRAFAGTSPGELARRIVPDGGLLTS